VPELKRTRKRIDSLKIDKEKIVNRIKKFYDNDMTSKSEDRDARLQRYAKYRQWTEGRNWIGDETSDVALPDMTTASLKMQDTIHNAVMSQRPPISSKATSSYDADKQDKIDNLLDQQFFVENNGEKTIEELAECFVNDGVYTVFLPWVKEQKKISQIYSFPPIKGEFPQQYFEQILQQEFRDEAFETSNGWDFKSDTLSVSFYTRDDLRVEMVFEKNVTVYDGPKPIVKAYEDVLHPVRCSNLQAPGPSNPNGATHVILVDYPTVDEIKRLIKNKFYDLVEAKDIESFDQLSQDESYKEEKIQKDRFQGKINDQKGTEKSHETLTRLMCFDLYDIDEDGLNEDVVWWMILENETLLKAKRLSEVSPMNPPRRPLAEATLFPVEGRREGMSLLEMMEGLHDWNKQVIDQMMDGGTLSNLPFFFYRPSSNVKQEMMRLYAGEGYPMSDPRNDVHFPVIPNQSQSFGLNMDTLIGQKQEKLTVVGDLQLGRVPTGKSSALRTAQGAQTILSQGEARPERMLRRFFMGLTEIFSMMHELNKTFLPEKKKFRMIGYQKPGEDPYQEIQDRTEIDGVFQYEFSANILNTSKAALQEGLTAVMSAYINPLAMQMGIVTPENIYRMLSDFGKAQGQEPDHKYLTPPIPGADKPLMMAEDAIAIIMDGEIPTGEPQEGIMPHFQKLHEFAQTESQREEPYLSPAQQEIFEGYYQEIARKAQEEMKQQQLMAAASQFNVQGKGRSAVEPGGNPQLQENELLAEDLPTSGGGGAIQ
jgi:hypothetical protein